MERSIRISRLKSMLRQVSPDGRLESLAGQPAAAAAGLELEGFMAPAPEEVAGSDVALEKLSADHEDSMTEDELHVLEAIIMPRERPVVFVRNETYDTIEQPWLHLNEAVVRQRLSPLLRSIGRIEVPGDPRIPYGGTGFVVGPDLLMTNRHVARLFCEGVGVRHLVYRSGDAAVNFKREVDSLPDDTTAEFTVLAVEMIHPFWDMALLRVKGLQEKIPSLSLSVLSPEEIVGKDVVAVGYPGRDDRNDLDVQDRIFAKKYYVKRLQPGKVRDRLRVVSFQNIVNALTHDSSTLGGNSGSAIVNVETGEVVGLHFGGQYLKANYAVPTYELSRDERVVRTGVNFAGTRPFTNDWEPSWLRLDNGETIPAVATAPLGVSTQPTITANAGQMTWTIPIQISVSLGGVLTTATAMAPAAAGLEAAMKVPIIYAGLEAREGYQSDFLGLDNEDVPLPQLTNLGKKAVAKLEDGSTVLHYHKFSLVMHKGRRMALFAIANVDWRSEKRLVNGRKPTRNELTGLPKNTPERWVTDDRIPSEHQLPDIFYSKDGGMFDKGHIVRRDDVCWGSSFKDIQKANGDTYHTTNCSPQVLTFNQGSKGEDNWGDLETLVQQQTKAEKAITLAGPVFEEDDPLFEGRDITGSLLVRIPRRFWKIILVKGESGLEAFGFVLEQDLSDLPVVEEFAVPKQWRVYMKQIAEIEEMFNGLAKFPVIIRNGDKFNSNESLEIMQSLTPIN